MMASQIAFHGLPLSSTGWAGRLSFHNSRICAPLPLLRGLPSAPLSAKRRRQRHVHGFSYRQAPIALAAARSVPALAEDVLLQFQTSSGARRLARTVKPDGKRNWIVVDASGVSHSVPSKQVAFILGPSSDFPAQSDDLTKLDEVCHRKASENEECVQVVWEYVLSEDDDSRTTNVETISELIFSDVDPLNLYASHLLMSNDKIYFKVKSIKGSVVYEARTETQVRDAQLMQEAVFAREAQQQLRRNAFLQSYEDRSVDPLLKSLTQSEIDHLVDSLKIMAMEADGERSDPRSEGKNCLQLLNEADQQLVREACSTLGKKVVSSAAMDLLVKWRIYSRHVNLALLKSSIPHIENWDASHEGHIDAFLGNIPVDIDREIRRDLTHLPSYAIDSADTSEVDDAISYDPGTERIYVHVADPTRYFPDGSANPILEAGLRRAVTLYLPYTKFTMFPKDLATRVFSLDGIDSDGSALSFGFRIEPDGSLDKDSISVEITKISAPIRYTYEEVEALLSATRATKSDDELNLLTLHKQAIRRKKWREMEGGAIIVNNPFTEITVSDVDRDDPDISIVAVLTDNKSWVLVSELMITACAVAAGFAEEAGIPVPFRGQEPFDYPEDDVLESFPDGPVRAAVAFRNATPSQVSTKPMEHASLGLDSYLQITSPIRRSMDLISHFQLKAQIRGQECPMSADDVQKEIGRSSEVSRKVRGVENRTKKYWQLEFLRRLGPQTEHDGVYVRPLKDDDSRLAIVHFEKYGFQMAASVPSTAKPGTRLKLKVQTAEPRTNLSRVEGFPTLTEGDIDDLSEILEDAFSDISS